MARSRALDRFLISLNRRQGRTEAIMLAVDSDEPPLHLVLGPDAFTRLGQKLGTLQAELMKWAPVSVNTDFPPGV